MNCKSMFIFILLQARQTRLMDGSLFNRFSYLQRYGIRLQKLALDAGFTCPNRDGTRGTGGCTFCDNAAFHPAYASAGKPIARQLEEGMAFHRRRTGPDTFFLAYFQAFSNTYAPLDVLRQRYTEALETPGIRGLVIGTRPDCVDDGILDLLAGLKAQGAIVEVEYGVESVYDETLRRINRGHDFATAAGAIRATAARGIDTCAHLMLGLPGETRDMLLAMPCALNPLPLSCVKFHQLQIIKGTPMEAEFRSRPEDFLRWDPEGYASLLADILERLRPDIAIGRIVSSVPPRFTDRPWHLLRPEALVRLLEERLKERNSWQGRLLEADSLRK